MANKLYQESDVQSIANAIRTKNGSSDTYKISQMADAILDIPSGSSLQSKSVTITQNGTTTVTPDAGYDGMGEVEITTSVVSQGVEEKDVNFYDYDGTCIVSYTKSEFANLSALPNNPSHPGLTAQGWNWTLSDAKTFVVKYGFLDIGQMYITDDNKTRVYVSLSEDTLEPYVGFSINGTATIDWGDNSAQSTVTGSSTQYLSAVHVQHTYTNAGNYVITISSTSKIYISGNSNGSYLLTKNANFSDNENKRYNACIEKIELGNADLSEYALTYCENLKSITMPNTVTGILAQTFKYNLAIKCVIFPTSCTRYTTDALSYCGTTTICINKGTTSLGDQGHRYSYSLKKLAVPEGTTTSMPTDFVRYCYGLRKMNIPDGMTTLTTSCFQFCYSMQHFIMPASVTTIQATAFSNCCGARYFDFTSHTSVPTLANANAFNGTASDMKIIVPDDLYKTWIAASNWSTHASKIIKESDWNA